MTPPVVRAARPRIRPAAATLLGASAAALLWFAAGAADPTPPAKAETSKSAPAAKGLPFVIPAEDEFRQVTVFGVLAVPDSRAVDPKLERVKAQLQKLRPGHGFEFRGTSSRRLAKGESVEVDLQGGVKASTELVDPMNKSGKIRFKFTLTAPGQTPYVTTVTTPPNQVFYVEKTLADGRRLLVGVGGR